MHMGDRTFLAPYYDKNTTVPKHTLVHGETRFQVCEVLSVLTLALARSDDEDAPFQSWACISSTRILGRRMAPFTPFLIPNRVPHGFTQDPSTQTHRHQHLAGC